MVIRPPVNPDLTPDALPLGAIDPDAVNLGVFSRPELRARGLTDADLRRKVRRGELLVPRRGWYAQPEADPDAVAAAKRYGALSCASALTKHKLWVPPGYESLHVRAGKSACRRGARTTAGFPARHFPSPPSPTPSVCLWCAPRAA